MKVSAEQIDQIRRIIGQSAVSSETLRDDILDHICCVVEDKLSRGKDFDTAVAEAFEELAPNGLDEIQRETVFLLNAEKIMTMRKIMYAVGLVTTMAMSLGWLFSILHWPGASELVNSGFLGFVLLFVPMVAIDRFKVNVNKPVYEKMRIILGLVSGLVTGVAIFFKLMHYPGADLLLLSGAICFIFGFLPFLFFTMYKKSLS